MNTNRTRFIERKEALTMEKVIDEVIREAKLAQGLNEQRVYAAWDEVSGAAPYTLSRYFRDGRLVVTLASSTVRNFLSFQKDSLVDRMNAWLQRDSLFVKEEGCEDYVKGLFLK